MKIISWNVNGIRAALKKGLLDFVKTEQPDILMLQEIKINDAARARENFDFKNYDEYWHPAEKPGYSGTAILVKKNIQSGDGGYRAGLGEKKFDREGRVQTLEFKDFYLLNVYFPHINHELTRLGYKLDFNQAFLNYANKLEKKKPVIIGGDYNVAREEIDLKNPEANVGNPGFTDEERAWMNKFLRAGFVDSYRLINGNKIQYTWWSYRFKARERNIGWRIDYFCASKKISKKIKNAFILDTVMGSDHCPVGLII
jgi:exodeoxyribonuclease III